MTVDAVQAVGLPVLELATDHRVPGHVQGLEAVRVDIFGMLGPVPGSHQLVVVGSHLDVELSRFSRLGQGKVILASLRSNFKSVTEANGDLCRFECQILTESSHDLIF